MIRTTPCITLSVLLFSATVIGCATAPQEEIEAAQAALTAADSAEADLYVADLYTAAADSFAAAQEEIEAQNGGNPMNRDYARAEGLLAFAQQTATEARGLVEERKETMRLDNETLFTQVQATLAHAQQLAAVAPTSRMNTVAMDDVRQATGDAFETLASARAAQDAGAYAEARDLAQAALESAQNLVATLQSTGSQTTPRS